jgi:UDP-N-acetylmuramoyl-tripeptide--D-alanyl-D-alanine ligase
VRAHAIEDRGLAGMRARVATPAGETVVDTPLLGRGNLSNVLAATAVAIEFGVGLDEITDAAARLRPADRRGAVHRLPSGVTVVDDSYNSSPSALAKSLDVVAHETGATRKVAVLGEMLELGDHAQRLHAESGRLVAQSGVDVLYAIGGPAARALAAAAIDAGMVVASVTHFPTSEEAAREIAAAVRPGDVVLVKGSRGIRTDLIADRIKAERA